MERAFPLFSSMLVTKLFIETWLQHNEEEEEKRE